MGKALITEQYLTNIGNAIRARNGSSIAYKVSDMAQAVANLPNQYSAGDEGKVVSSGALVGQSTRNVTENGSYDTTLNNEVVVSVSGGSTDIEDWDLTNSLIGTQRGWELTTGNVVIGNNGSIFDTTNDYLKIPNWGFVPIAIELNVVSMTLQSGSHRRFIMATYSDGFIYRSTGKWAFYNSYNGWVDSDISDGNYFDNCTIKVIIDVNGYWHIYKDGVLVWEPSLALKPTSIMIGSDNGQSINNAIISAMRIF